MNTKRYHLTLLAIDLIVLIWSAIKPHDYFTWFLEVLPALIAFVILYLTYNRFRLSNTLYTIIAIHAIVLMIGGKYTYAEVPLGYWMEQWFGWTRNNYDKIGHFMQGFTPALLTREVLLRTSPLRRGKWLALLAIAVPLAFSAFYEFVEWWVSVATGSAGDSFLGTQGYVFDTQSDMFMCFVGSIVAVILLTKLHDRSLKKVTEV